MRKVSVYFACFFILIAMGCGNESGDPTARITTLAADPAEVTPGGSTVITATVMKAVAPTTTVTGTTTTTTTTSSGWGENVTFTLLTANGAQLSVLKQKTDGDGRARTVYTAGNNYNQDVIYATLDNGMSASLVIKKTGNVSGASIKITEPTTPASVKAFGYVSIAATVTDSNDKDKPISGQIVEFTLAENNSGASLITHSAVTDAAGHAVATYRAGGNEPAQDVVKAKLLSNGSTSSIVIDVTAGGTGPVISSITASPPSVKAGQQSIVTVKVTDGSSTSLPVGGELVTMQIVPNKSGASLIIQGAYTDAQGQVVATYVAGNPSVEVTDTVQARVASSGSVNSVIITVTIP